MWLATKLVDTRILSIQEWNFCKHNTTQWNKWDTNTHMHNDDDPGVFQKKVCCANVLMPCDDDYNDLRTDGWMLLLSLLLLEAAARRCARAHQATQFWGRRTDGQWTRSQIPVCWMAPPVIAPSVVVFGFCLWRKQQQQQQKRNLRLFAHTVFPLTNSLTHCG